MMMKVSMMMIRSPRPAQDKLLWGSVSLCVSSSARHAAGRVHNVGSVALQTARQHATCDARRDIVLVNGREQSEGRGGATRNSKGVAGGALHECCTRRRWKGLGATLGKAATFLFQSCLLREQPWLRRMQNWSYIRHVIDKTGHIQDWSYTRHVIYKIGHIQDWSYARHVIYKTGHIQDTSYTRHVI